MPLLDVISAITTDRIYAFVTGNLIQQIRQDLSVTDTLLKVTSIARIFRVSASIPK